MQKSNPLRYEIDPFARVWSLKIRDLKVAHIYFELYIFSDISVCANFKLPFISANWHKYENRA